MDLRVQRTRKLLWEALLELLAEKPFEQVQVDELCQRAMVHRTTFYKHYRDKHDLAARGAKAMLQAVTRELARAPQETTGQVLMGAPDPQVTATLAHVAANPAFYRLAFSPNQGAALPFRAVLERFLTERILLRLGHLPRATTPPPVPDAVTAAFTVGAVVSLLAWWVNDDFKVSQETMAEHVTVLLAHGAYPAAGLTAAPVVRAR
jgi:AcrR family transcriptional regulator